MMVSRIRGLIVFAILLLNVVFWGSPIMLIGVGKFLVPLGRWRRRCMLAAVWCAERWAIWNNVLFGAVTHAEWVVEGVDELRQDGRYLIIANHVSALDIAAILRVIQGRVPFPRFFVKSQLAWFPIVGFACWTMEFPFMRRYSHEYLERHPEKRGEDLERTRRACRRYRRSPFSVINFVEGTRLTPRKHAEQESPYRHLLLPRIGGVAHVLATVGPELTGILDVTLAYPGSQGELFDFLGDRVPRIFVHIEQREIPKQFLSDAITVPGPLRDEFGEWIRGLWREKDELLERQKAEVTLSARTQNAERRT